MMCVSWSTVSVLPAVVSEGTSGETPPWPFRPWHWAQANWTNSCAPAATFGSTAAELVVATVPTVVVRFV